MLVYCEIAYISLLSENDRIFAKIVENTIFSRTSSFFGFSKKSKIHAPWRNLKLVSDLKLDSHSKNTSASPACNRCSIQLYVVLTSYIVFLFSTTQQRNNINIKNVQIQTQTNGYMTLADKDRNQNDQTSCEIAEKLVTP